MKLSQAQVDATGGCAACQATPIASPAAPPGGPSVTVVDESKPAWIGVELVDEQGAGLGGEDYEVTLPDGTVMTGRLDGSGRVRIEGIDSGQCVVSFPKIDKRELVDT